MSNTIIKVEHLSKQYRLGKVGTGFLLHDINRFWHAVRGLDDPYLKVGETNERDKKGNSKYVWSLRDVSFDINQGETVGIIGRNGAGKSTLLKIISRTTSPTLGSIKIKGKVASLLEVGTGFHPELSGRENIFLNGAILGMTKDEIRRKFDEIVDFAGVERYVDTPVKRYSSGMYVRLAFGVAAHLEPDILVVDEVLAVGDAEFQKKALGKMKDISKGQGRTVLFVSHNMASLQNLCEKGILMQNGQCVYIGDIGKAIDNYLNSKSGKSFVNTDELKKFHVSTSLNVLSLFTADLSGSSTEAFKMGEPISIVIDLKLNDPISNLNVNVRLTDSNNVNIAAWRTSETREETLGVKEGRCRIKLNIEDLRIFDGLYNFSISVLNGNQTMFYADSILQIEITPAMVEVFSKVVSRNLNVTYSKCSWEIN